MSRVGPATRTTTGQATSVQSAVRACAGGSSGITEWESFHRHGALELGPVGLSASRARCPGEVATDILDKRPVPVTPEERARMVQEDDVGETILFVARMPPHVCLNEIQITPTWNRGYIGTASAGISRDD